MPILVKYNLYQDEYEIIKYNIWKLNEDKEALIKELEMLGTKVTDLECKLENKKDTTKYNV